MKITDTNPVADPIAGRPMCPTAEQAAINAARALNTSGVPSLGLVRFVPDRG